MRGGCKRQASRKRNLTSLFIWLGVQVAIIGGILWLAWLILMPIDGGLETRILALEAESGETSPSMLRVYKWREAIGWSLPFIVIMLFFSILLWSINVTVKEIAECRERMGMKR